MNFLRSFGMRGALGWATAVAVLLPGAPSVSAEGAALTEREIEALVPGKVLAYRNDKRFVGPAGDPVRWVPRADGSYADVEFSLRTDHSVRVRCTAYSRTGAQSPCIGMAANDVGVWSVEAGGLCIKWLNWGTSVPRCYRLLREGSAFRARQISGGPSSMDGALVAIR